MENMPSLRTGKGNGKKGGISDGSTGLLPRVNTGGGGLTSSPSATTATTRNASRKTWTSAGLAELQRKIGLVAGALSDFQTAGGLVVVRSLEYEPGKFAVKIYLVAEGLNIRTHQTADGLDLVAETYHHQPEDDLVAVAESESK